MLLIRNGRFSGRSLRVTSVGTVTDAVHHLEHLYPHETGRHHEVAKDALRFVQALEACYDKVFTR